ncbi:MAG: type III pantothenate kinase [Bacteroidia bacterium]
MINLVIDIGNTAMKAACFQGKSLIRSVRAPWSDSEQVEEALLRLIASDPKQVLISSVSGPNKQIDQFLKIAKLKAVYFTPDTKIPLLNKYETPETLGRDRLANSIAASSLHPGKPIVVIDAGTCIKFDFITMNNEYFGGSISPGIDMRFRALHEFTARLPLLERTETVYLVGKNTIESIHSGVINGALAEVKGILEQYQMTHKDLVVIVTGGDYALLQRTLKTSVIPEPWLTLKGLNEIIQYQAS